MMEDTQSRPIVYMDAVLRPNRSLSPRAFTIVMAIVAVFSFGGGVLFWSMGAIPVVGFFGLDAVAIWAAFRLCFKTQDQVTRVRVTADKLTVDHRTPKGELKTASLPTAFVRVYLAEPVGPTSWIKLSASGQAWVIGRFLAPDDRKSFVEALRTAISNAKLERYSV